MFAEIRTDPSLFAEVDVDAAAGTIARPNGADLAPDALYEVRPSAQIEAS